MSAVEAADIQADSMMAHALHYAERGWHVFPCNPQNKAPFVESDKDTAGNKIPKTGGLYKATTDATQIRTWWQRWPRAMIGVRMGAASGVWAIDPDAPKEPLFLDGRAAWDALVAQYGAVHTHAHLTPAGGQHLLFKWDPARPISNREGTLKGTGINVRGEGGYVIAPPSRRADGKTYEIVEPLDYFNFAEAPDWLYELILANPTAATISERAVAQVHSRPANRSYAQAALHGEYARVAGAVQNRNIELNNAALKLGTLVGAGALAEAEVVGALYDAATTCGYVASDGHRATMATIESGLLAGIKMPRMITEARNFDDGQMNNAAVSTARPPIAATPYVWKDAAKIAKREWLYGYQLVRKFVSATVAPGGVGKSSLIVAETLSQVSARDLLGILPPQQLRVWLWNLEDPQEETERKVQATALHYKLTPDDIGDRLYVDSGRDQPLVIATTTRTGTMIARPVVDALIAEIIRREIDVVVIDPFVSCHEVSENDNQAMDSIVKEWGRVADRGNCAIHLIHHTRKMGGTEAEVTTETSRGGKALTDGCRVVRAVNRMSKEEAEKAGVANHRLYFRTFNDKANLQPPADQSDWFRLESVDLGNGTLPGGFGGDSIGVVMPWKWPDPLAGMTGADFDKVAAAIRSGRWRENPQAKDWAGNAVAQALGLNINNRGDKTKAGGLLKHWIGLGTLRVVEATDAKSMVRKFVEVSDAIDD